MARTSRTLRASLATAVSLTLVGAAPSPKAAAQALDTHAVAQARFGNDAPWYEGNIPFFESADPRIDAVYYYRWALFRAHQRDLGAEGYISTEFLDDVPWQRHPYASLNDATGFHLGEGRWLADRRYAGDIIDFMYRNGGNDRHFTDYMADSVYGRFLVDGDRTAALAHLPVMRQIYRLWDDKFDFDKGLYFVEPLLDATEYTVSSIDASGGKDGFRGGDAFRPSINSYMFANARALSKLAEMAGDMAMASEYADRAETLRVRTLNALWSGKLAHFIDRHQLGNQHVRYWQSIRTRELVGYVPWAFDLPPNEARYAEAWKHLTAPDGFAGKHGLRTVEPSYEHYMRQYRYLGSAPECQWNGPVWPYQTTQALLAMGNLLDHYDQSAVTRSDYMRLLRQYAELHYQGAGKDERLDLEEDYHPDTGKPIVGLDRSHHYFHSGYVDLVMTGLVGIRPRADDVLEVNPLIPEKGSQSLAWFRMQDVPYHGHRIAVTWDADGRRYGRGKGLGIEVDGRRVAQRPTLGRLTIDLPRAQAPTPVRPIDLAVQLVRGAFPKGSASSNADVENVHDAIDGRLWFFPELPNGWSSAPSPAEQWYEVDFGRPVRIARTELAFFADGTRFAAPTSYRLQAMTGRGWTDIEGRFDAPLANGVTHGRWAPLTTDRIRVLLAQPSGRATRLVEFKLFDETPGS